MFADFGPKTRKLQTRNRPDVHRDREHATRRRTQRAQRVATFFFRGDVFEVTLLLLDPHIAEAHLAFELWPDAFAKIGQREGFDVEGEGAWNLGLGILKLAILIDRGGAILTQHELVAILKTFQFSLDRPQARLHQALRFSNVAPKP